MSIIKQDYGEVGGGIKEFAHYSKYVNYSTGSGYSGFYNDSEGNNISNSTISQENAYIKTIVTTDSSYHSTITFYAVKSGSFVCEGLDNQFVTFNQRVKKNAGEVIGQFTTHANIYGFIDVTVYVE